jgi:hypothetical protein
MIAPSHPYRAGDFVHWGLSGAILLDLSLSGFDGHR